MLEPGQRLWCLARLAESGEAQLMPPLSQTTWRGSDDPRDLQDAPQRALWLSDIKTQTERVQYHSKSEPRRCLDFVFFLCEMRKMLIHYFGYFSTLALASFFLNG